MKITHSVQKYSALLIFGLSLAMVGPSLGAPKIEPVTKNKTYTKLKTKKAKFDLEKLGKKAKFDFGKKGTIKFESKKLKKFDFKKPGKPSKKKKTGDADMILSLGGARVPTAPGSADVDIELVALSLVSVNPIDIGSGKPEHLRLYNPTDKGSTAAIHFANEDGGTFDAKLKFDFKLKGLKSGKKLDVKGMKLKTSDSKWSREPPPNALSIPGINDLPDPFWPQNMEFSGQGHSLLTQVASPAANPVPEPATFLLLGTGLLGGGCRTFHPAAQEAVKENERKSTDPHWLPKASGDLVVLRVPCPVWSMETRRDTKLGQPAYWPAPAASHKTNRQNAALLFSAARSTSAT